MKTAPTWVGMWLLQKRVIFSRRFRSWPTNSPICHAARLWMRYPRGSIGACGSLGVFTQVLPNGTFGSTSVGSGWLLPSGAVYALIGGGTLVLKVSRASTTWLSDIPWKWTMSAGVTPKSVRRSRCSSSGLPKGPV